MANTAAAPEVSESNFSPRKRIRRCQVVVALCGPIDVLKIGLKTDFYYRRLLYHRCVIQAFLCTSIVSICPQALQLRLTGPVRRGTEDRGLRSSQGLRLLPYLLAEGAATARRQRDRIPKEAGGCRRLACEAPLTERRPDSGSAWQEGE